MAFRVVKIPHQLSVYEYAALEEWLVRYADCSNGDLMLLYINEPCVVLGKNQCVYKEVNAQFWLKNPDRVVRRVSGGGTVYHDKGNLNFGIISAFDEKKVNNYAIFNEPVRQLLNRGGVPAVFNSRNDMVANGKKISGNAQFTNRKNILSHGTILVDADLDSLRAALRPNTYAITTKAVGSVSSSVANIVEFTDKIKSARELKELIENELSIGFWELDAVSWDDVKLLAKEKYSTYEWVFGRSPLSTIEANGVKVTVNEGVIIKIDSNKNAFQSLEGTRLLIDNLLSVEGQYLIELLTRR